MSSQNAEAHITRVQFSNFKGFERFSLALEPMTMLVGPNNAGKSTIIGAFRALSVALRRARSRKPEVLRRSGGYQRGYSITTAEIPISLENARHNYSDSDAVAAFTLSNGRTIRLVFAPDMGCSLEIDPDGPAVRSVADFKRHYPIDIGVVPVLGPFEHDELLVQEETVQRNLQTPRASRNFRNYWHRCDADEFSKFRQEVMKSWDGIDIERPRVSFNANGPPSVHMMCTENRITRELYWMGFGFHIWLQIMTHALRTREATLIVMDEPETYMHPTLQRDLLNFLRDLGSDCLLATHSSELVAEAERTEIVVVDKAKRSGKRLGSSAHVGALDALGSRFNFALTDVLRQRVAILVEGESDLKYLKLLGRRLSSKMLGGTRTPPLMSLGGHRPDDANDIARAMKTLIGPDVRLAVVLDRDYRSDTEVEHLECELMKEFDIAHVLRRKEIENYFVTPSLLTRTLDARARKNGQVRCIDPVALLESITEDLRAEVESQCLARFVDYEANVRSNVDRSTLMKEAIESFRIGWLTVDERLHIVSGKNVLQKLNSTLQGKGENAVTISQLAKEMRVADIPHEVASFLRQIDQMTGA